jgi:Trk K+ transport system NAD-binding subunit
MFNTRLGFGVREMFHDCAILSDASMAAPNFVAAVFGELTPTHVRLPGRTLFVARRQDVRPQQVMVGLADTSNPVEPDLLPDDESRADLVLAVADGAKNEAGVPQRMRRRGWWRRQIGRIRRFPYVAVAMVRVVAGRRLWRGVVALLAMLIVGSFILSVAGEGLSFWRAVYTTLINAFGGSVERWGQGDKIETTVFQEVVQLIVVISGVALIPFITAAVVELMVTTPWASLAARGYSRHVIVIGLGNVGTRVVQQLHDLGIPVVAIDKRADARGAEVVRQLEIPLIIGDAGREETLRSANVGTARALVALSTDDVINLEAALQARAVNPEIRLVLRLFDGDFAELVQRRYGIMVSRSVSYVAAPAFAAAMLERKVIGTIAVERRVLLVAEVPVAAGSMMEGRTLSESRMAGKVRVIGYTPCAEAGSPRPRISWTLPAGHRLSAGDTLVVIATRTGLGQILTESTPPA